MWAASTVQYFINWNIRIYENGILYHVHEYNANDRRIYISLDSKSLGDTLAWMPYAEEFRKKHKCKLILSTFMNHMFDKNYKDIEFVNPGTVVNDLYAMYSIGLFYDENGQYNPHKNPTDPKLQPMQKMCSDILGLEYKEIKPRLSYRTLSTDDRLNQVCIAIHSTAQAKYWNNSSGWQDVVDWLNNRGYVVRLISKENNGYMNNFHPSGVVEYPRGNIELVIDELIKSKAFIGIGSGLSWLSWALNIPTVIISGFSYKWAEMDDCIRIGAPEGKCEGCFNRIRLDAADWNWCPDQKGTERQFECTKSITSDMVIAELEKFL
jgi:autotransporter strand-loop-strand O-heptosyltransferase